MQPNIRLKALAEISTKDSFAQLWNPKASTALHFCHRPIFTGQVCKLLRESAELREQRQADLNAKLCRAAGRGDCEESPSCKPNFLA